MAMLTVNGAIVSEKGVTIYLASGDEMPLSKESWNTTDLLKKIMLPIAQEGFCNVELNDYRLADAIKKVANELKSEGVDVQIKEKDGTASIEVDGETVVSDVNDLAPQLEAALGVENSEGIKKFLASFARVAKERRHSADDLMKFIKKHDLPITEDGRLIAYKKLTRDSANKDGWVDTHSRSVPQQVGSIVEMDISKVDADRRNECSYGLHVGTRAYMGGFGGNDVCLVLIDAADVVAVPEYDANKMRVCRYQIAAQFNEKAFDLINANESISKNRDATALLAAVIAGNIVQPFERVIVGKNGKAEIVPIEGAKKAEPVVKKTARNPFGGVDVKDIQSSYAEAVTKAAEVKDEAPKPKSNNVPAPRVKASAGVHDKKGKSKAASKKAPEAVAKDFVTTTNKPKPTKAKKPAASAADARAAEYEKKLAKARKLYANGKSIREIAKELKMDRAGLSKNLK